MGVKIEQLYDTLKIKNDDVFPLTQSTGGTDRITLKVSTSALKDNFTSDINSDLDDLEDEIDNKTIDPSNFNKLLPKDGSKSMAGDLYMTNSTVINYSAKIKNITDNYTLKPIDNASIILVNKENSNNDPDARVEIIINENILPVGFNIILIQTGNTQIKIIPNGSVEIWNADNFKTSKQKYSLINICVLKTNKIWLFGDMVFSLT